VAGTLELLAYDFFRILRAPLNDYFSAINGLNGQGYVPHSFEIIVNSLWSDLKLRVFEHTMTWRFARLAGESLFDTGRLAPVDLDGQLATTLGVMKGNYDLTDVLSKGYNFPVYHFLQPMMATGLEMHADLLNDYTRQVFKRSVPPEYEKAANQFYQAIRDDGRWIDLSKIFVDTRSENVYFDEIHLGPDGNELVAKYIFAELVRAESQKASAAAHDLVHQGH
jgi:hypothetical protein